MKANKKKIIVLVSMVFLLVATGCLSYFLNTSDTTGDSSTGETTETQPTFFELCRDERTLTRDEIQEELDEIITSTVSSAEAIETATTAKQALTETIAMELMLETLIKGQGFEDALVTIGTENINIVVQDDDLSLADAAQILNIIVTETSYTAENVVIIPYV